MGDKVWLVTIPFSEQAMAALRAKQLREEGWTVEIHELSLDEWLALPLEHRHAPAL